MINYEYNIREQRWEFTYLHHDGRESHVYLKPDFPEKEIIRYLVSYFNSVLRARDEASS